MSFASKKTRQTAQIVDVAPARAAAVASSELGQITSHDLGVLVVNEEADILDEVAALLRRRGLAVYLATSADQARAIMVRHPEIGVLVADIALLEGEGLSLAAEVLGGKPPMPPIELVLITGYSAGSAATGPLLNHIGLLQEPLRLRDIAVAVGQALCRAATRRALPPLNGSRTYDA